MEYSDFAKALKKPGHKILSDMTADQADLWHLATGVAGEAGELLDAVKKHAVYQKPLDRENVIEELGDIEFYLLCLRQMLNITRQHCLDQNRAKLSQRYHQGSYSNEQAQARADKNG